MKGWLPPAVLGVFVLPVLNVASKRLVGTSLPVALALALIVRVAEDSYGWTGPNVTAPVFYLVALHQAFFEAEELLEARYSGALRRGVAAQKDTSLLPRFGAERAPAPRMMEKRSRNADFGLTDRRGRAQQATTMDPLAVRNITHGRRACCWRCCGRGVDLSSPTR